MLVQVKVGQSVHQSVSPLVYLLYLACELHAPDWVIRRENKTTLSSFPCQMFSSSSAYFSLWLFFFSPSPDACPQTTFTFFLSCYFFLFGHCFPSFLPSCSSFFFSRLFSHLLPHLLSAYAAILLHEISVALIFRDIEVRTFRDTVLKFRAFAKTLCFESLWLRVFELETIYFFAIVTLTSPWSY